MPPSKKKKKKGEKRSKSSKPQEQPEEAIDPFEQEIRGLQEKLAKIHASRQGENDRIEKGTGKTAVQRMQLIYLQSKIERIEEEFLTQKDLVEAEFMVEESEAEHHLEVLEQEVKRLEIADAHFQNLQERSKEMDLKIQQLLDTMAAMDESHALQVHSIKKEMLDFRRQLEHNFRKMLMDKDIEFQRQAFQSLSGDKKEALLANAKLKEEMTLQSIGLENLGQRAGAQSFELDQVKHSTKELQKQSEEYHVQAALLRKQMRANDKLMSEMQESIRAIAEEEGHLVDVVIENNQNLHPLEEVQREMIELQKNIASCESEIERWKGRALEFTSQISGGKVTNPEEANAEAQGALGLARHMLESWEREDARNPFRDAVWYTQIEPQLSVSSVRQGAGLQRSVSKSRSAGALPARSAKLFPAASGRHRKRGAKRLNKKAGLVSSKTLVPQHQRTSLENLLPHSKTKGLIDPKTLQTTRAARAVRSRTNESIGGHSASSTGSNLVGRVKDTVVAESSVSTFQNHRRKMSVLGRPGH